MANTVLANYEPLTPLSFLKRAADVFRERTAVVWGDTRYTWPEFMARTSRLSSALAKAGIKKGDKVAFLCRNLPPMLEAHYGVPGIGALLVALNTRLAAKEVTYIINHSEAKAFFVEDTLASLVVPADLPGVKLFVNIKSGEGGPEVPGTDYESFIAGGSPDYVKYDIADENEPIAVNYTSGTTGPPKGVVYTHRSAYLQALAQTIEIGYTARTIYLWTLPMFHCNGWCRTWATACMGSTNVCIARPDAPEIYRLVEKEGVTHMDGAPIVWARLGEYMEEKGLKFDRHIKIASAGAATPPKVMRAMEARGAEIIHIYGLTESYGPFTICEWQPQWDELPQEERIRHKLCQGVPTVAAGQVRVVDPNMVDVPADGGTLGEIIMRGNVVMQGYLKQPEASAEAFAGGWFHTGDGAVMHPDGYIEIKDRFKDIIISGGENISSIEVENVLVTHPDVLEAACFGIKDEKWGEVVKALVKPKPGTNPTAESIVKYCRQHLAHYKCPRVVVFGEVPRTSTGKIAKYILRQKYGAMQGVL